MYHWCCIEEAGQEVKDTAGDVVCCKKAKQTVPPLLHSRGTVLRSSPWGGSVSESD